MKILGISGGTPNGNNDAMCKQALMGAQEVGAEIEFINLNLLNIQHCTGCKACVMALFSGRGSRCADGRRHLEVAAEAPAICEVPRTEYVSRIL